MTAPREDFEQELIALITARSFRRGQFTLASGRTSTRYFNLKPTMMHPRGAHLAARAMLKLARAHGVSLLGGVEMGAVPIVAAAAALSDIDGAPMATFFVRKQAKGHGTQELIEGLGPGESLAGRCIAIAEDVTTTGGSAVKAAEAVRAAGGTVDLVITLLDREEGAQAALGRAGLKLAACLKATEFD